MGGGAIGALIVVSATKFLFFFFVCVSPRAFFTLYGALCEKYPQQSLLRRKPISEGFIWNSGVPKKKPEVRYNFFEFRQQATSEKVVIFRSFEPIAAKKKTLSECIFRRAPRITPELYQDKQTNLLFFSFILIFCYL